MDVEVFKMKLILSEICIQNNTFRFRIISSNWLINKTNDTFQMNP